MSSLERNQILRLDCPTCNGNGYIVKDRMQRPCPYCGGVGMREAEVPYRPEGYSLQEAGEILGIKNPSNRLLPDDPAFGR